MDNSKLHIGHRQRVRESYLTNGINGTPEHNVLEHLLFYGIPYKDTNPIAHELIDRFGSIKGVFNADISDLTEISGMGENSAILIKLCNDIFNNYIQNTQTGFGEDENYRKVLELKFSNTDKESVYMLAIDSRGKIKQSICIANGGVDSVLADKRNILSVAVKSGASSVVIAHNHPNGFAAPSTQDIEATAELAHFLGEIDITLADHLIFADGDVFSMAHSHKFGHLFG